MIKFLVAAVFKAINLAYSYGLLNFYDTKIELLHFFWLEVIWYIVELKGTLSMKLL